MELTSELHIDAAPERVWELTVDVERWPTLTPTVTRVTRLDQAPFGLGSQARIKQPGQRAATWTVTDFAPTVLFAWETTVGPITMRGGHHLTATPDGGTRNVLTLELTGFAGSVFGRLVGRRIQHAIDTENQGFKAAAERVANPSTP